MSGDTNTNKSELLEKKKKKPTEVPGGSLAAQSDLIIKGIKNIF
jgi:hypothetical protein